MITNNTQKITIEFKSQNSKIVVANVEKRKHKQLSFSWVKRCGSHA